MSPRSGQTYEEKYPRLSGATDESANPAYNVNKGDGTHGEFEKMLADRRNFKEFDKIDSANFKNNVSYNLHSINTSIHSLQNR